MILKDMRLRSTFSPEDSANLKADRLACLDYYAHVLMEYTDAELTETLKVATGDTVGTSDSISTRSGLKYKEAQYHGELAFANHVERIVLPKAKYAPMEAKIQKVCAQHGWEYSWMEDEKLHMEQMVADNADGTKVTEWKKKLQDLMDHKPAGLDVQEGFCIKGCGRPVAEGMYYNSRTGTSSPYKTCCRGCAMGFGHELRCEWLDRVRRGLPIPAPGDTERGPCKKNCGIWAAPGTYYSKRLGRRAAWDTCCRACKNGRGHDPDCGFHDPDQKDVDLD